MPDIDRYEHFDPAYSVPGYHPRDAWSFCLASHLAYQKNARKRIARRKIADQARRWGFGHVEPFEIVRGRDVDTQGFIAVDESRLLAAFRGTESLPDWLTNLQTVRDPGPWRNTRVHEGFQDAFHAAALRIGETIGRERGDRQVWLTGHSLGGALAVLLAATLLESAIPVTGLYTFGAPRVGNNAFASHVDAGLAQAAPLASGEPGRPGAPRPRADVLLPCGKQDAPHGGCATGRLRGHVEGLHPRDLELDGGADRRGARSVRYRRSPQARLTRRIPRASGSRPEWEGGVAQVGLAQRNWFFHETPLLVVRVAPVHCPAAWRSAVRQRLATSPSAPAR